MERAYLLLRNNQQCGPFTIGELLQQQLRPSDMIWIEGKSTAWTYISELELIPFVKKTESFKPEKPGETADEIERKAEELRQRILNTPLKTAYFPNHETEIETYASPYKFSENEIQFVDYRKEKRIRKNTVLGELILTCFVIGLFIVGIYKGKSFLGARHKVQTSVATQLNSGDEHTAKKKSTPNQVATIAIDTTSHADSVLAMQKKQKPSKKIVIDSLNTATLKQEIKKDESLIQPPLTVSQENDLKKDDTAKKEIVPSVPEIKTNAEPVKEEKRGFLRGLFKKKKKEEETTNKAQDQ